MSILPRGLQKVIADLARQLDKHGPVRSPIGPGNSDERGRCAFKSFSETQNTDLTNRDANLLDVISRINSTTKKFVCRHVRPGPREL